MDSNSIRTLLVALFMLALVTAEVSAFNPHAGIWISPDELMTLPVKGESWERLKTQAAKPAGSPNLSDKNQKNNVYVFGKALVYARCSLTPSHPQCHDLNLTSLRNEVINQVMATIGTEKGGRTLALGRELAAYVIAADLVGLPPERERIFRNWLQDVRVTTLHKRTLVSTHEDRPNNWGTHAGASRAAIAVYLGDTADLERTAQVLQGFLGDRSAYSGFKYGSLWWQCNPKKPVGINPKGCTKDGHSIDGVLPDDQRRGGRFSWPPPQENYVYEALQGALVQAVILQRAGYNPFHWADKALLRAYRWLHDEAAYPPTGDDTWQLPLVDYFYGTNFWDGTLTRHGKNMGWTDWTHTKERHH